MALLRYGPPLSLAEAKKAAEAAQAEAAAKGLAMVIAVVDSSGHLAVLHRMDHAQHGSIEVAQAKARTAVNFKRPSKAFEEALAAGGVHLRLLGTQGVCPVQGGVLLLAHGAVVGAIGASGATPAEDEQVAQAGAHAFSQAAS